MKKRTFTATLVLLASVTQAVLVVDYNYDFENASAETTSGRTLDLGDGTSGVMGYSFDENADLLNGTANGGAGATSVVVFGGWKATNGNSADISDEYINMPSKNGRLVTQSDDGQDGGNAAQAVVMWDSANFLGVPLGAGETYAFDGSASSSFAIDMFRLDGLARMVVREGSDYYISTDLGLPSFGGLYTFNATDVQWAAYDPTTDFTIVPGSGFVTKTFSNVTAIGYYGETSRTGTDDGRMILDDQGLDISLAVIPEPATISLITVFSGGILFIRRLMI